MKTHTISFAQAILEATDLMMEKDPSVYLIGEGVPDPKAIFGTTKGLQEKYGASRVMDMPVSENGLTGILIGSALRGMKPILTHQRVDFALLSMDQIVNTAAKWNYMFGGDTHIPLVIRMIIGRGWGQGAQHSQSLQALFAHIPGLSVVMPTTPEDAKGLLISAIENPDPVIYIEHRWLHGITDIVPDGYIKTPIGKALVMKEGKDVTIVSSSFNSVEAMGVAKKLETIGISAGVVDLRTIRPLDRITIIREVKKSGRVVVYDCGWKSFGVSAEVIATIAESDLVLRAKPVRLTLPDTSLPSSPLLTKGIYPTEYDLCKTVLQMVEKEGKIADTLYPDQKQKKHDVPNPSFTGPF